MHKPKICITANSNREIPRSVNCSLAYTNAIAAAGGIPLLTSECCAAEMLELCDGLLLTGGPDLDPQYFGEPVLNDSVEIDDKRDAFEMELTKLFLSRKKPILTICRGFQLLNVVMGGDLWQDLTSQLGFIHSDSRLRHPVHTEAGSMLSDLFGTSFRVNSTHHQAVRRLAPGLRATARSVEDIIEAYEGESLPIWGTQFHPERLTGDLWDDRTPDFAPWFSFFIRQCHTFQCI